MTLKLIFFNLQNLVRNNRFGNCLQIVHVLPPTRYIPLVTCRKKQQIFNQFDALNLINGANIIIIRAGQRKWFVLHNQRTFILNLWCHHFEILNSEW